MAFEFGGEVHPVLSLRLKQGNSAPWAARLGMASPETVYLYSIRKFGWFVYLKFP
jgi:hypothetical protein